MESLVSILESYDINESFKSQTLREFMTVIDKESFTKSGKLTLPQGIAWDKIEEKDVFYGETGDDSFYKNFVSKNEYVCIWYPLVKKEIHRTRKSTHYLEPGRFILSTGSSFIQSPNSVSEWKISPGLLNPEWVRRREDNRKGYTEQGEDETDWEYRRRTDSEFYGDHTILRSPSVPGRDYVSLDYTNITVKSLFERTLCGIIAISKKVIAENDTSDLINSRFKSKVGAIALMLEPISDQEKRDNLKDKPYYSKTYNLKATDYPLIRRINRERYEKVLKVDRYKHKGLSMLKKYEPIMKEAIEAIEKYSKEVRTVPTYIKMISDEDFIDVYFNHTKGGDPKIANYIEQLQQNYDLIVSKIDKVIERYKEGHNNGSWWIDDTLKEIEKAEKNIRIILDVLNYIDV